MALRGLYAVTPDEADTALLVSKVQAALAGGMRLLQYRNKVATPELRREQALALKRACDACGALLIINDHPHLAREVGAAGVHIGAEDGEIEAARAAVGADGIVGVSCYRKIEVAVAAEKAGADYVAFGSFYPSSVKPGAVRAPIDLLRDVKRAVNVPVVAIGGITIANAPPLIEAGADAVAVITAVFGASDVTAAARGFTGLFA
ncbi:MAG TPA: thiamine phosphate synthase [Burkholderiales bacterium]|nr:thiamine phosphate synthase [Burkholderiales bacterium]